MEDIKQKQVAGLLAALTERVLTTDPRLSDARPPTAHTHDERYYTEAEADQQLAGKVNTTDPRLSDSRTPLPHTHLSTSITDFAEAVQDAVAAFMQAGGGVTLTYDDANNTYTITSSPGETFDPEKTRDAIGAALVPLGLIDIAINDAGDTISISTRATQNAPDAQLRERATHTGTQGMDTVEGLASALANKTNNATTAALSNRVAALEAQVAELMTRPLLTRDNLLALLEAGTNITIEPTEGGQVRINAAGGGDTSYPVTPLPPTGGAVDVHGVPSFVAPDGVDATEFEYDIV